MGFEKYLSVLLFLLFLVKSCFSVETFMNTTLASKENVFLSLYTDKDSYCEPELVNITNIIENRGNLNAFGNLTTKILNPEGQEIKSQTWQASIGGAEIRYFITNYSVSASDSPGIYTVKSNFSYSNEFKYAETSFRIKKGIGTLVVSPLEIEKTLKPGNSFNETIYIWLLYPCFGANITINKSSGFPGDWFNISRTNIFLPPTGRPENFTLSVIIPKDANGSYVGYVYVTAENQVKTIKVTLNVNASAIFELKLEVPQEKKEVCQGDEVYGRVNITKIFPEEEVQVNLTYKILDSNGSVVRESKETLSVISSLVRLPSFNTSNLLGYYTFQAILEYKEIQVLTSDIFRVISCLPRPPGPGIGPTLPPPPEVIKKLELNVSEKRIVVISGNQSGLIATVKNLGTQKELVKILIEGIPLEWIRVIPENISLPPEEAYNFLVLITAPKEVEDKIFYLSVMASNSVKSNEEIIMLIIAKDWKSAADILLKELERIKKIADQIPYLNCLNLGDAFKVYENAEYLRKLALEEYGNESYQKAASILEYSISLYEKAISLAEAFVSYEVEEISSFRLSFYASLPFFSQEINLNINTLKEYVEKKEFQNFCLIYNKVKTLIGYSRLFNFLIIPLILIILIVLIFVVMRKRKIKKERKLEEIFEKVKKRVEEI
ncbi:MAG: hypothetical protein QXS48_05355 [Candidatus Aenigmatarchaeota archaeon]